MPSKTYRLRISRNGNEFEAEGDKGFILEMLKRFSTPTGADLLPTTKGKDAAKRGEKTHLSDIAPTSAKTLSIREFIQRFGFTKHTDITLAFGYYLEKHSGISEFTSADINNCYYEAKLESSNTSQMIVQNIKSGRMMPSKKKGTKGTNLYTLTSTGEEFIKSKLSVDS